MDASPQVIIENVRTRETMFSRVGDMIEEAQIKIIKADHIIVVYDSEDITLEY